VLEIECPGDLGDLASLGLTLTNGKQLLTQVQQAVVAAQCRNPCHPAADLPIVRDTVPGQGLPATPDRHPVRSGHTATAAFPLRQLWWDRGWCQLAFPLPLDT
jgi:hypothetical protein